MAYLELRFQPEGGQSVQHFWVCDTDGSNRHEVPLPAGVFVLLGWW